MKFGSGKQERSSAEYPSWVPHVSPFLRDMGGRNPCTRHQKRRGKPPHWVSFRFSLRLLLHGVSGLGIVLLIGVFNRDGLPVLGHRHAVDPDYLPVPLVGL